MRFIALNPLGASLDHLETVLWDKEAGALYGRLSPGIEAAANRCRERGLTIESTSGLQTTADPLKTEEGLGVLLLSLNFHVPPSLQHALPEPPPDDGWGDLPGAVY